MAPQVLPQRVTPPTAWGSLEGGTRGGWGVGLR